MKPRNVGSVLVTLLVGGLLASVSLAELEGSSAPDFVLKSTAGTNLRLSEYRGRVVMVSFWASWCGQCRSQLEGLEGMRKRYEGAEFELLAVSLDTNLDQARDAARALGVGFPVLHDANGSVSEMYGVDSMPLIVLIDRDGIVRERFEGYRRGREEDYLKRVRALLSE